MGHKAFALVVCVYATANGRMALYLLLRDFSVVNAHAKKLSLQGTLFPLGDFSQWILPQRVLTRPAPSARGFPFVVSGVDPDCPHIGMLVFPL